MNMPTAVGKRSFDIRIIFMALITVFFLGIIIYPMFLVLLKSVDSKTGFTLANYQKILVTISQLKGILELALGFVFGDLD